MVPVGRGRNAGVAAIGVVLITLVGCGDSRVNKANFDKINIGMTLKEVQDLLGPGTKQSEGDGSGVGTQFGVDVTMGGQSSTRRGEVYEWESGARKIIIYLDMAGKVANKQAKGL